MRIIISVLLIALASCSETPKHENAEDAPSNPNDIVKAEAIGNDSNTLYMTYDNTEGTAVFVLNSDTMYMHRDTMASGVKYSNGNDEYNEWHGHITLKKDGVVVFEKGGE